MSEELRETNGTDAAVATVERDLREQKREKARELTGMTDGVIDVTYGGDTCLVKWEDGPEVPGTRGHLYSGYPSFDCDANRDVADCYHVTLNDSCEEPLEEQLADELNRIARLYDDLAERVRERAALVANAEG